MTAFDIGDQVIITFPPGREPSPVVRSLQGQRGKVAEVLDLIGAIYPNYPYVVELPTERRCFAADELLPAEMADRDDVVNHPSHYTWLPNGLEVIDITRHFSFVLGNALKYVFRAGRKGPALEDLRKARWYIDYEIKRLEDK